MSDATQTEIQYAIAGVIPDYLADPVRMGIAAKVIYALADAGFEITRKHKPEAVERARCPRCFHLADGHTGPWCTTCDAPCDVGPTTEELLAAINDALVSGDPFEWVGKNRYARVGDVRGNHQ